MPYFGYELHPPSIELDADIRWVLLSAFADAGMRDAHPASPERAARLIQQFSLISQVTSRLSARELAEGLTPALYDEIADIARRRVMRSLAVTEARELVCRAAKEVGVEIVLLKQAALEIMGLTTPAQRCASDVDILVDPSDIPRVAGILRRVGCQSKEGREHAFQAVAFRTPRNVTLELHIQIPYVRLAMQDSFVDIRALKQRGMIEGTAAELSVARIPSRAVLGAHLVAQGLVHYRFASRHKPPFRLLTDAHMLGLHNDPRLARDAFELIRRDVTKDEYDNLVELVRLLDSGKFELLGPATQSYLNHALAASTIPIYLGVLFVQRQLQTIRRDGIGEWARRQFGRFSRSHP